MTICCIIAKGGCDLMFGERLKTLRENNKLLQKELADILGVTSQTISGWEINRTTPDYETLVKISKYFGVSIDFLLGNEATASKYESELQEKEVLKNALINAGYMQENEDLTDKELENLMDFVKTNKKYIKETR